MVNRRKFLFAGAAISTLVFGFPLRLAGDEDLKRLSERLRWIFSDLAAARTVGQKYLESHPSETAVPAWMDAKDAASLKGKIAESRERDFREGNIVFVDGWVLARTEARLCALAARV